ncbi:hypothetical protein L1887_62014 [Cichorium endivia]|nr:hypothetical protein L1887_62014 [Cichorium endivia]
MPRARLTPSEARKSRSGRQARRSRRQGFPSRRSRHVERQEQLPHPHRRLQHRQTALLPHRSARHPEQPQSLWTFSTHRFVAASVKAQSTVAAHHELVATKHRHLESNASHVEPLQDQTLFARHNQQRWQEPAGWSFEPCVGFFDTPEMSTEPAAVTVLQNRPAALPRPHRRARASSRNQGQGGRRAAQAARCLPRQARAGQSGRGDGPALRLHACAVWLSDRAAQSRGRGGDHRGEHRPEPGRGASASIQACLVRHPHRVPLCGGTIWGLAKQGAVCKPCGYTVHQKCEIKVPAECKAAPASEAPRVSASLSRSNRSSAILSPARPAATPARAEAQRPMGSVLYAFEASSPFELSVTEGEQVELLEDDVDATGWIKVRAGAEREGLVPTTYCEFGAQDEMGDARSAQDAGHSVQMGAAQGCGQFVKAVFDYTAQGADEHSLTTGEQIEITTTGFSYADG